MIAVHLGLLFYCDHNCCSFITVIHTCNIEAQIAIPFNIGMLCVIFNWVLSCIYIRLKLLFNISFPLVTIQFLFAVQIISKVKIIAHYL